MNHMSGTQLCRKRQSIRDAIDCDDASTTDDLRGLDFLVVSEFHIILEIVWSVLTHHDR